MPRIRVAGHRAPKETLASKNTAQFKIGLDQLAGTYARRNRDRRAENNPFKLPAFPPAVVPAKASGLAMDDSLSATAATAWAAQQTIDAIWSEGLQFLGYTYLSEIAQRAEYRVMSEVIAEEMTRNWIRLQARGDEDKSEKISELKDYLDNMRLRTVFYNIARLDGLMGRSHIYIDTGSTEDGAELKTALGNGRDDISKSKLKKGALRAFKVVEPIWAYPTDYNSSDPLADNWYRPDQWYAMSRSIHRSRLLTFVGRPVPDLLKPSYAFGGLSLSQMAKPYVDNWLRTRQSVSDLVHSFTVFKLATDMSALMADQGDQLFRRMELFNNLRDNSNLFLHDKETEEFTNVSAPLGTLDAILNKSQEQMCTVARIPVVKLLGIQAMGLNASSEGELTAFYDTIEASQERLFRPNLTTCIDFAQLSLWGEVDEDIVFEFEPLRALDRKQEAEVRKTEAETGQILVSGGIISQEEERVRISSDPDSMYDGLDPNDVPDLQEEEEGGLAIPGAGGAEKAVLEQAGGEGDKPKPGSDKPKPNEKGEGAKDAAFSEGDHPRAENGQFGSGGGGSAGEATEEGEPPKPKSPKAAERIKGAATWLKTAAAEKVLTGDNIKSAAAIGIKSALYHGLQFDDAMMNVIEDYIHLQVKHISETTAASQAMIRKAMLSMTDSLINLRMVAKDSDEESDDDPILSVLKKIKAALDGMDIAEDSEFKEGDHPRAPDGKFGSGHGGASSSKGGESDVDSLLSKVAARRAAKSAAGDPAIASEIDKYAKPETFLQSIFSVGSKSWEMREGARRVKAAGIKNLTPTDAAHIVGYVGRRYKKLNGELRGGSVSKDQAAYAKNLNAALDKLPKYKGQTLRGVNLTPEQQAMYKPGAVVEERGFTSSGKAFGFDGNTKFIINGKNGRDISKLTSDTADTQWGEVLFKSGSRFRVERNNGRIIELTEVDDNQAHDAAEFKEGDHPRAPDGKFGSGHGGASGSKPTSKPKSEKDQAYLMKKAAKGTKVIPSGVKGASKLESAFNDQWAGKALTDHDEIKKKMADFAKLKEGIAKLKEAEPKTGAEYFLDNWHKSGSVGGHEQPTKAQVDAYTAAWENQGKGKSEALNALAGALTPEPPLNTSDMKRVGKQMGSNPGGVFETKAGERFYIKQGKSKEHVDTELAAADLYKLAGTPTLAYRPVEDGKHIATKMEKLGADRLAKLSPAERAKAQEDFVTHAWLANWDAVGLGGDNIGTVNGVPTALDLGGAMTFRAMGSPKGAAFGTKVGEIDTLRNKSMNADAASLYGPMTDAQIKASAQKVTSIPNAAIKDVVKQRGLGDDLAKKLILRKNDIAARYGLAAADAKGDVVEIEPDVFALEGEEGTADPSDWANEEPIGADEFSEAKIKRDKDGKFSGTGGGGSSAEEKPKKEKGPPKPPLPPGVKSKKEHVGNLLKKGVTVKEVLQATGWPSVSMPQMAKSLGVTLVKKKEGNGWKYYSEEGGKAAAEASPVLPDPKAYEPPAPAPAPPPSVPTVAPKPPEPVSVPSSVMENLKSLFGMGEKPKPTFPTPSPSDAQKAKKGTKIIPSNVPGAKALEEKFDAKWANKDLTDEKEIAEKVHDYKQVKAEIEKLSALSQAQKAALQKAEAEKEKAAEKEQLLKKKAELANIMKELGVEDLDDAEGVKGIAAMTGASIGSLITSMKAYESSAKNAHVNMSSFEYAALMSYIGSGYTMINPALRQPSWDQATHAAAKLLNTALQKMPTYTEGGTLNRYSQLPSNIQQSYVPGHIVEERAFTSSSTGHVFSSKNTRFHITKMKTARDLRKLNSGENEILFPAKTMFKVTKNEKGGDGKQHIHMEEVWKL